MADLESLNVEGCRNLVEVHQSVGFLNKLSLLNVQYCCKLIRLPDLKLPRLQILQLGGCTSLEKFPNIVGEIPLLGELWLNDSPNIQELPLSVEYLIGLQRISIFSCKNLRDLPRSISKLPRLRELVLLDCRNLGRFPKSSSSSSTNLGWLASSKGNKTQDKSHSVGWFPALRKLKIIYCNLEEVDFLKSLHCLSTLEELYLSGNNFVSLPAPCNTGFTHLRSLALWHCNGLQQKNASIDVFPNGFGKMITTIKIRGGELPEWFRHQTREIEMCFRVPPPKNAKLAGLVIGVAFKPHFELSFCYLRVSIIISNGRQSTPIAKSYEVPFHGHELGLDGALWLLYLPRGALEWRDEITNEGDHFGVSFQIHGRTPFVKCDKYNNRLGVHFVFEQNDNMDDDDPRVIRHYPSPNNKIAILENDNCCQLQQQLAEQHARANRGQSRFLSDL